MKEFPFHPFVLLAFILIIFSFSLVPQKTIGFEPRFRAEGPIQMEADRLTYDQKGGFISMEGEVEIVHKGASVRADKVIFYTETKDVVAEGRVVLKEGEDVLRCDRLEFNIETKKGMVYEGRIFLKKKNFHITGSRAEKLGEMQYRVYDATLTSCDEKVPSWKFSAKRLDVEVEGWAKGWWPGFHVKNVPVLYFPWAIFPVKRERQSGFLFPEFSNSSKWGPEITIPFYWAIAPNQDATFYLQRIGDSRGRGFKEGAEYRYALSRRTQGKIKGFYIWDEREDDSRWSIFFDHDQRSPEGYYLKADVNWVSDKEYPVDFDEDIPGEALIDVRSSNQLESNLSLGKNWKWGTLGAEFSYFRDLTVHSNRSTMQRLPQATFQIFQDQFPRTPLFYELEAQGTHFWRQEGIRGGRIDIYPKISVPLRPFDILRFEPWVGYRETIYFPDNDPEGRKDEVTSREIYDVGATLATTISKLYSLKGRRVKKLRHLIEPEIVYTYIPKVDQTDNPYFDDLDYIPRENTVTWNLTNRLIGKVVDEKGGVTYPEYLYLKFYQSYDFFPHLTSEERLSNLGAEMRFAPFTWLSGTMDAEYNHHHSRLDLFNAGVNIADKRGDCLGVEYRFSKDEVEELNAELLVHVIKPLDLFFSYRHNLLDDVRIETVYGLDYHHQCWEISLRLCDINRSPDELRDNELKVMVYVTLSGIGRTKIQ
ncbi:MAG: LPS-assembly protein LptD [Deltaproteobacteria bacterium]|nr:LPS-assembly protein LptD [Deltaproteobacteria bacterium]